MFVAAARGRAPAAGVLAALGQQAQAASWAAAGGVHGFPAALTSFIGRAGPLREVAGLLCDRRLVTVTGPGGAGKTRLAAQVARLVAGRFADGAWLAELAPVADPAQVAAVVAAALGVREQPGRPAAEALARALARQQVLLVLDNCEHVIGAAAALCAGLLAACDDVRVLATSREPLRVAGEARYRLASLALPDLDDLAEAARAEAVALFADRARHVDAHFTLDEQTAPAVARLVTRLDGMPLAIELAAAQVEALGVTGLLGRLDGRLALLAGGDRLAPSRQRSLAATVAWSYQLLDENERRVFRAVSVFPAGFTLEGAEAVAGEAAGPAVLRLVDCSLLTPPRDGPDGRPWYSMLETLRGYGAGRLAESGEQDQAAAALARWALGVAEQAAAGLQTRTGERVAARWLDAEDATMRQVLAWAMDQEPEAALRLAIALGWWWFLRGRLAGQCPLLAACRDAGDLMTLQSLLARMAELDLQAGRTEDAAAHLREALQLALRSGFILAYYLDCCGHLCAATGRHAEAVTAWAAWAAHVTHEDWPRDAWRRQEPLRTARQVLGPGRARAAEDRGAAMSFATAAEYALMLTSPGPQQLLAVPGLEKLSARERDLIALVAQGATNAQIAAQLSISVRTVGSHLDRIRDKTGCRRRADLTRLALTAGLL